MALRELSITDDELRAAGPRLRLVEPPVPLPHSMLWSQQRDFYQHMSIRAWTENHVPSFSTSNGFLARCYAKLILAFMRDWFAKPASVHSEPMYLVELGAGHGRLAFLILSELLSLRDEWPTLQTPSSAAPASASPASASTNASTAGAGASASCPFRYVLSDFCPETIAFWRSHESLRSLWDAGLLFSSLWDAEEARASGALVVCDRAGSTVATLSPSSPARNPIVCLANYVFDTLRMDAYRIVEGQLQRAYASVHSTAAAATPSAAAAREGANGAAPSETPASTSTSSKAAASVEPPFDPLAISRLRAAWSYRACSPAEIAAGLEDGDGDATTAASSAAVPLSAAVVRGEAQAHSGALLTALQVYLSQRHFRNANVVIPVGGLGALSRLVSFSAGGRLFALVGDKAHNHEDELVQASSGSGAAAALASAGAAAGGARRGSAPPFATAAAASSSPSSHARPDPHLALHGSFSHVVNMHAMRLYVLARGGFSLTTPHMDGFKCGAFALGLGGEGAGDATLAPPLRDAAAAPASAPPPAPPELLSVEEVAARSALTLTPAAMDFSETVLAWADHMDTFGPENFNALQRLVHEGIPGGVCTLAVALPLIRLSGWDPEVFFKFKETLIGSSTLVAERAAADLFADVLRIGARYYPLVPSRDVPFDLGRICMGLKRYRAAIHFFQDSRRTCGDHHVTLFNMGACHSFIGEYEAATGALAASLNLSPEYEDARSHLAKVREEMEKIGAERAAAAVDVVPAFPKVNV